MSLLQHFARQLQVHGLSPSQKVAVAVSGGSDSLALALLTAWWRGHGGIPEPLASVRVSHELPHQAAAATSPPQELLHAAEIILQRRRAAPGPAPLAADKQRACWVPLQHRSTFSADFPVHEAAAREPAYAVIVDHALRPESAAEAAATAEMVGAWGLQPLVLQAEWPQGRPRHGSLMRAARAARQRLYQQACRQHGITDLLVGHQADDQAETFLIRLSRGSGIAGIAGMMPAWRLPTDHAEEGSTAAAGSSVSSDTPLHADDAQQAHVGSGGIGDGGCSSSSGQQHSLRVLRPLLGVGRSQLQALLRRCRVAWVDDPTNADISYSRNAIRSLLSQAPLQQQTPQLSTAPGQHAGSLCGHARDTSDAVTGGPATAADLLALPAADPAAPAVLRDILRLQERCAAVTDELDRQSAALLAACAPHYLQLHRPPGSIALALTPLLAAPHTVAVHVLAAVLQAVSGAPAPPKLQLVVKLLQALRGGSPILQRNICGCCVAVARQGAGRAEVVSIEPRKL